MIWLAEGVDWLAQQACGLAIWLVVPRFNHDEDELCYCSVGAKFTKLCSILFCIDFCWHGGTRNSAANCRMAKKVSDKDSQVSLSVET